MHRQWKYRALVEDALIVLAIAWLSVQMWKIIPPLMRGL